MNKHAWKFATALVLVFVLATQSPNSVKSQTQAGSQMDLKDLRGMGENSVSLPTNWLDRLNYYRGVAGLPPVPESAGFSADLAKHVNYMLLNVPAEGLWHGETPGRPGYTPEGDQAAAESNLYWYPSGASYGANPAMAIDGWMASIKHRYGMLHPDLTLTGFSFGCDSKNCGAGLNVIGGIVWDSNPKPNGIVYPGAGQKDVNTDITITWQFYLAPTVVLKSASLKDSNGQSIAITTTQPADGDYFNMVSVKPQSSLSNGRTYVASITVQLGSSELSQTWNFSTVGAPTFADVPASHPYYNDIEILYANGLTAGCSTTPLKFCPDQIMNRAQASVFMMRGTYGSGYVPNPATSLFQDDWSRGTWARPWVEAMRETNLTTGCKVSPPMYCPWNQLPREQAMIFALKMKYGNFYQPPPATGAVFADMTNPGYYATAWAEQAYADGLIQACGTSGNKPVICPGTLTSRGLAAYMIVRAKNLSMP